MKSVSWRASDCLSRCCLWESERVELQALWPEQLSGLDSNIISPGSLLAEMVQFILSCPYPRYRPQAGTSVILTVKKATGHQCLHLELSLG